MSARPMIIGEEQLDEIRRIKEFAEANPFSLDDLLDVYNGNKEPAGMQEEFKCFIPVGYRIIFTIEHQPQGLSRHLSMSVPVKDSYPHPESVNWIMELLGFKGKLNDKEIHKYLEKKNNAINVIELINESDRRNLL